MILGEMHMIIPGLRVGHSSNTQTATGVTVLLFDKPCAASVLICGSAPATREIAVLSPDAVVQTIDAVVFAGGSAFGLGCADGVMRWLKEQGRGIATAYGLVPIVPTACIYDFTQEATDYPTADDAYQACEKAQAKISAAGQIGAGTGATVGKIVSEGTVSLGGFGSTIIRCPNGLWVAACVVVNSMGDVVDDKGFVVAGRRLADGTMANSLQALINKGRLDAHLLQTNTTLVAVLTNAKFDKAALYRIAKMASGGMARAIVPVFTSYDGDIIFAASLGKKAADEVVVGALGAEAVRRAIVKAVQR